VLGWDDFKDGGTTAADATATAVLLALGCGLVALQARTVPLGAGPAGAVLGVLLPLTVPVAFLAICGVLLRRLPAGSLARVLRWTLAWGAALGIASLVAIAQQRAAGVPLTDEPSMVALFVSVGSLAGALIGAREVQGDILERRLRDENDRTERLNHQLSVLSRILRHDLRNGLNVIYGYADVLADDTRESPERFARHIRDRAEEFSDAGRSAVRIPPKLEDVLTLAANEDLQIEVDLRDSQNILGQFTRRLIYGIVLASGVLSTSFLYAVEEQLAAGVTAAFTAVVAFLLVYSYRKRRGIRAQPQFTRQSLRERREE